MTLSLQPRDHAALDGAVRSFTQALSDEDLAVVTTHVEARLSSGETGPLFALDSALAAAWPGERAAPRREVIWALGEGAADLCLQLSAFDVAGRVLLRRRYDVVGPTGGALGQETPYEGPTRPSPDALEDNT